MPKLENFQLLLFDVDNTLTGSDRTIRPRTQAALKKITDRDIAVGVCTGRTYPSLLETALPFFAPDAVHVTCGGGQVISTNGKIYWQELIPSQTVQEIVQHAEEFQAGFLLTQEGKLFVNQKMRDYLEPRKDLRTLKIYPYTDLVDYSTPVIPVFDAPLEFYNYLNERDDVNYKQMKTYERSNADITAKGVNKATGIKELSKALNIPVEKIVGFGDSENDDEFLNIVGFGVAMGNATPYLKSIANRTIGHTDENGLAIYLEHIAEGAEL
jgi:5-amino-6-(5-phospho-D-ribitylamino)uracil phosphatase